MPDFKAYFIIPAPRDEVYNALTKPLSIKLWTGEECKMSTEVGSEFSLWGDSIVGKNLEFVQDQLIVQQWYFDGEEEESIVRIKLHEHKKGTSVELNHSHIPQEAYDEFEQGWRESYMSALLDFFE